MIGNKRSYINVFSKKHPLLNSKSETTHNIEISDNFIWLESMFNMVGRTGVEAAMERADKVVEGYRKRFGNDENISVEVKPSKKEDTYNDF